MTPTQLNTILLATAFLVLFTIAEVLYRRFNFKAEVTRKIVHIGTGLLSLLFPALLDSVGVVGFLCGSFLLILIGSMRFKLLPSINNVDRKTYGSLLYPVTVFSCFVLYEKYGQLSFYYIPILILALCDPIAALVGKRKPLGQYTIFGHPKTMSGSSAFFVAAFVLAFLLLHFTDHLGVSEALWIAFCSAFVTTIAEGLSHNGFDNLTIPAASILILLQLHT